MSIDGRPTGAHQLDAITISSDATPPAHPELTRSAAAQSAPNSAGVASTTVARPVAGLAATCPTRATSRPGSDTSVPRHTPSTRTPGIAASPATTRSTGAEAGQTTV